ncbi:hypothetical protein [Polluticaenibacter yanchengensis]|uniref:Uncharacterized protein n=1 Tax=Polluticaenibacter yanchengensis TaxID=3014562 RepID=A0ABT4UND2_9BACT|nr:hypothetical protein [Chitinophagaceae bacterium LY-5]
MKKGILTIITFFSILIVFGQNGLKSGNLFLLLKSSKTISINSLEKDKIKEHKKFAITKKSIYATDQTNKVAILDTSKNIIKIFDIQNSTEITLTIPFGLKSKSILLNNDNLFIGGELEQEMLVQYHIKSGKWYSLEIPDQLRYPGKAIDDIIINDSMLIAVDNIVTPKYILYYLLNSTGKISLLHFKHLKSNGAYENIHQARITKNYLGLISSTFSGYSGASFHITIYDNLELTSSFAISSNQQDKDYHSFTDFLIINDKLVIASYKKGLGIIDINKSYFKDDKIYSFDVFNAPVSTSLIKYFDYKNAVIKKLTIIPNTEQIVITLKSQKGKIKNEVKSI